MSTLEHLLQILPGFDLQKPWLPQLAPLVLWGGLFALTVLIARMIVTRWGDSNVTAKALAFSVLMHLIGGLWATTVVLSDGSAFSRSEGDRVQVYTPKLDPGAQSGSGQPATGGRSPAPWERPQTTSERQLTRATLETDTQILPGPEQPARERELAKIAMPNLAEPGVADEQPQSVAPAIRRQEQANPSAIGEETAQARADVVPAQQAGRQSRTVAAPESPAVSNSLPRNESNDVAARVSPSKAPVTGGDLDSSPPALGAVEPPQTGMNRSRTGRPGPAPAIAEDPGNGEPDAPNPVVGSASKRFTRTIRKPSGGAGGTGKDSSAPGQTDKREPGGAGRGAGGDSTERLVASVKGNGNFSGGDFNPMATAVNPDGSGGRKPGSSLPSDLRGRMSPRRGDLARKNGATDESELAVDRALKWMSLHQSPEGNWDPDGFAAHCNCTGAATKGKDPEDLGLTAAQREERERSGMFADTGVTGLVLLTFLGRGHTHLDGGPYADNIDKGLRYLVHSQTSDGNLSGNATYYARAYCHAMATIALAEAYTLTKEHDDSLAQPLLKAVQHIIDNQNHEDGGWRYEKGNVSDMSVFGWQLMALKRAEKSGVQIPPVVYERCSRFLSKAGLGTHGGLAAYGSKQQDLRVKASMTAESLFCRQLMGQPRTHAAAGEAVTYLSQRRPALDQYDLYYWYYGTLALREHGGPAWDGWNDSMRDTLVQLQRKEADGHAAGSWDPYSPWGDFGGRLYSTALSTLCLESYYRYLPR